MAPVSVVCGSGSCRGSICLSFVAPVLSVVACGSSRCHRSCDSSLQYLSFVAPVVVVFSSSCGSSIDLLSFMAPVVSVCCLWLQCILCRSFVAPVVSPVACDSRLQYLLFMAPVSVHCLWLQYLSFMTPVFVVSSLLLWLQSPVLLALLFMAPVCSICYSSLQYWLLCRLCLQY